MKNYLIIDVESTCSENNNITSEIIEIGICKIINGKKQKVPSIFIKPQKSEITPFCTKLTSLTKDFINKNGEDPTVAYKKMNNIFREFDTWCSYGEYDKKMFINMASLYGIKIELPKNHINVRKLFAEKVIGSENPSDAPKNPKDSMEKIGLKFNGFNHRGDDDAFNIAKLFIALVNYKKELKEEIKNILKNIL